ncbi:MAG: hypothetical protein JW829_11760, partial [Pirellulales bacterium]|nr:hypothetical protein [Pirellulales bacterium]
MMAYRRIALLDGGVPKASAASIDCHALILEQADRIERLEARVDELWARVDELVAEVAGLRRQLHGPRRERFVSEQPEDNPVPPPPAALALWNIARHEHRRVGAPARLIPRSREKRSTI